MRIRSGLAITGAILAGLLAACSGGSDGTEPTPTSPAPTATSPADPSSPAPSSPAPPPVTPSPRPPTPEPGATTLTGQVVEGVEAGCKLLQTGAGLYLLTGDAAADLEFGRTVTVRGRERPDLLSTCQQGTPFEVTEVLE